MELLVKRIRRQTAKAFYLGFGETYIFFDVARIVEKLY